MRRTTLLLATAAGAVVLAATACGGQATPTGQTPDGSGVIATGDPTAPTSPTPEPSVVTVTITETTSGGGGGGGGGGDWPSPEDCINYNPANANLNVAGNGNWTVTVGSQELLSGYGDNPDAGAKALALVKSYRTVCYVGRGNSRDDLEDYTLEYWKNPTGSSSPLLYDEDDCSSYNPNNLRVDDTGSTGWRVRDDDHPLQHFKTQSQANNGRIVLRKYNRICQIRSQSPNDDTLSVISYF